MPDRSSRSQRGGGFISISGLMPPELPDYQSDINKQMSFLKSMEAYMNPGGSGGSGTIRNANGLTPYQQAQLDYKLQKDAAKAAEAEAKKNVVVGVNPKTGQPMIYRNETGYKLSDKRVQEIYASMLEDELRKDIANDAELNRIKGIAFGPKAISLDYRKELERQYRDRTKALASIYKIDDRAAFDAAFGDQSKSIGKEQRKALREESFFSVLGSGIAQGWSDFLNAVKMPFQNETERLETARQSLKERQERIAASPTLREREMEEQEAAEQGKEISYWQATDKNRAANLAASVGGTLTSFAPVIAGSMAMAPFTGGASLAGIPLATAVPIAATGVLGAGMNQLGQAQRAAQDPNLTEAQKTDMLSMSDPGFASTTLLGGAAGMLMPGGVGSGIVKGAGSMAFRRAAAAGPINPATVPGLTGRALRAGAKATERAAAPRTLGTLGRDIAVNSGENAAIMGANTIGANIAYNKSTGQPLTQGATQGVMGAVGEGAIIGVPFGGARTLRRVRAKAETTASVNEAAAETPSGTGEKPTQTPAQPQVASSWTQELRADGGYRNWVNAIVQESRTKNGADNVDKLIAEYLAGGGRLEDLELLRDSYVRDKKRNYISDDAFAKAHGGLAHIRASGDDPGWTAENTKNINAAIARWKEASDNGTLNDKIAGAFTGETGESRVASIMAKLEQSRKGRAGGENPDVDSPVEANPTADAKDASLGTVVQNSSDSSRVESERPGGKSASDIGQDKSDTANAGKKETEQQTGDLAADLGSPRPSSLEADNGPGSKPDTAVRRDGNKSDANADSSSEQSAGKPVATRGKPKSGKDKGTPDTLVIDGATFVRHQGVKNWKLRTTKGKKTSDLIINTKSVTPGMPERIKAIKPSKRNEELNKLFDENVGNIRESRVLPQQQYTSRGTSRNQIPGSFKKIPWVKGTRNLDIGAGRYEQGTEYLRSQGVENTPFDPYNRATDVNNAALDPIRSGEKYDTVTAANLLNVIYEPEIRDNIIKQAAHALKPGGKAYFQVYEGDRSGVGRQTKTGGTSDNWQNARTLDSYKEEIGRHFGKVEEKDGVLTASEPKDPGPVEWSLNDTARVREARGWHGSGADFDAFDLSYAHSGEGGSAHGWGVYTALEEKSPFDKTKRKSQYSGRSTAESYRDQANWRKAKRSGNTVFESSGHRWVEGFNKDTGQMTWLSENGKPVSEAEHAAFVTVIYEGSVEEAQNSLITEILDKEVRIERLNKEIDALETTAVAYNGLGSEDLKALKENYDSEIHLMNMYEGALKFLDQHEDLSIIVPAKSRLYNVEVPDAEKLLHLDNTFAEQPPFVQDALRRLYNDNNKETAFSLVTRKVLERYINGDAKTKGRGVYETLDRELGSNSAASHMLNYYGIEGNYVFGHRDGPVAVVFNDKAVEILSKERRGNTSNYLFSYEQAVGELAPFFKTQKERDVLATISQLGNRPHDYIATLPDGSFAMKSQLIEQAMQIVMSKLPGFKRGKMRSDYENAGAYGRYHHDTGDIFIDAANIRGAVQLLDILQHELGHKSLAELANPSLTTYTSEVTYREADPTDKALWSKEYGNSRADFIGEELYAQYESGYTPFADAESMRGALTAMLTERNDEAVPRTVSRALSFFARNAEGGTFNEFLKATILGNKKITEAFTTSNTDNISNALTRQLTQDYRTVAREAGVPLNSETLGYYLDAVLDHDTSLNVWKRQSMPC